MSIPEAIQEGKVEVWLDGKKLQGGFALIRTDQAEPHWVLVKMRDKTTALDHDATDTESDSTLVGQSPEGITN